MTGRWSAVTALVALACLALVPLVADPFQLTLLTRGLVWGLLAASLWALLRMCGLVSFGHAAFFGVAAYVTGIATTIWEVDNVFVALLLGVGLTCAVSVPLALVAGRLQTISFLLVTLAFAEMLRTLALRWRALGGSDGLPGVVRPDAWPLPVELATPRGFFYFTLAVVAACLVGLYVIARSAFGHVLVGLRESSTRMAALGYHPAAYRAAAVLLSAGLAAVAGVLHAYLNRFVNPEDLGALVSARALLTVVVGGVPFIGPPLAALALTFLEDILSSHTDRWLAVLGALYLAVSLLVGLRRRRRDKLDPATAPEPAAATPTPVRQP